MMGPMGERVAIDTSFNFTTDTPSGRDPDRWSPTLHRYHQVLWSRDLPSGRRFDLEDARPVGGYLQHRTPSGRDFRLSSDAVMQTFTRWTRADVISVVLQATEHDRQEFYNLSYTIGGMMLFPGNQIERMWTINQARGCHPKIADRLDLTLECIRRHYLGEDSPLGDVLQRYRDFFELFETFQGYVEHFLLQDLVSDLSTVEWFLPCDDFQRSPLPQDSSEYSVFRKRSVDFIRSRNQRMRRLASAAEG